MAANLIFGYSTMNAGKTLEIIKIDFNYTAEGKRTIIFTSAIDTRSGQNKIKSRMGPEKNAYSITAADDLYTIVQGLSYSPACILVDEVQFFTVAHIWQLFHITHQLHIPVMCYGLRSDFMGNPFPASAQLMAIANKIEEIRTICHCGKKAIMNARIMDGKIVRHGEQIQVGGNESYEVLCGPDYLSGTIRKKM